jgi:NAD(P)-dependent dehydrogenase (short-subunit alcohol dehydrogenase family)
MVVATCPTGLGAYPMAKSALDFATRVLAREVGSAGVRVNAVHPGVTWGPNVEELMRRLAHESGTTLADVRTEFESRNALRRLASGEEVANAVVFLASDLASAITGQSLHVNAGGLFH